MAATTANVTFNQHATSNQTLESTTPSYTTPVPAQSLNSELFQHQSSQGLNPVSSVIGQPQSQVDMNHQSQPHSLQYPMQQQQQTNHSLTQEQNFQQQPTTNTNPNPVVQKQSSLQNHVNKVKTQLETKGGKQGTWLANQLQTQVNPFVNKVQIVGDINSGGSPIMYQVFRGSHVMSKDDVVKDMNGNPVYYLQFPHNIGSSWSLTFYRGGQPIGQPLATIRKQGSFGNPMQADDMIISFSSNETLPHGFTTKLVRTSLLSSAHEFDLPVQQTQFVDSMNQPQQQQQQQSYITPGNTNHQPIQPSTTLTNHSNLTKRLKWKSESKLNSNNLICIDLSNGFVVATWEKSYLNFGKDGSMKINPMYQQYLDLIVVTGLCIEGFTSNQNLMGMGMKFLGKKK
ncbi:hypothetical protein OIO90_002144 [Microbotryomycetes sp. JL221]|nr:hypothetical protein OIO90_002144 [Microbotryomycetes sp. JL221]